NHYGLISFTGIGLAERIDLIHPKRVQVFDSADGLAYKIDGQVVEADRIIHVPNMSDDIIGKSTIRSAREDLSLHLDTTDYGTSTIARGWLPIVMSMPKEGVNKVTEARGADLVKAWLAAKAKNKAVAVRAGGDCVKISMDPEDVAWVAANEFSITPVARWFG